MSESSSRDGADGARVRCAPPPTTLEEERLWQRRWLVSRSLRMCFWVLYDHMGRIIASNIGMITVFSIPVWILIEVVVAPTVVTVVFSSMVVWSLLVGQCMVVNALLAGRDWDARLLLTGMRQYGVPALILGAVVAMAFGTCGTGVWFYGYLLAQEKPLAGVALSQLSVCALVMVAMAGFFLMPALLAQGGRPLRALSISIRLAAGHPVASAGLLLSALVLGVVMVSPPGLLLMSTWPIATLACCAYELLARYYDTPLRRDTDDEYLNRGVRDFLFPWKG